MTNEASTQTEPTREELEAFIKSAGFTYGWENLESWGRRMAEAAVTQIKAVGAAPTPQDPDPESLSDEYRTLVLRLPKDPNARASVVNQLRLGGSFNGAVVTAAAIGDEMTRMEKLEQILSEEGLDHRIDEVYNEGLSAPKSPRG